MQGNANGLSLITNQNKLPKVEGKEILTAQTELDNMNPQREDGEQILCIIGTLSDMTNKKERASTLNQEDKGREAYNRSVWKTCSNMVWQYFLMEFGHHPTPSNLQQKSLSSLTSFFGLIKSH